jgi:hypothetical protein
MQHEKDMRTALGTVTRVRITVDLVAGHERTGKNPKENPKKNPLMLMKMLMSMAIGI